MERVELSGGLDYEENVEDRMRELSQEIGIQLQLHNYSPPPKKSFVLNLASLHEETHRESLQHVIKSLEITKSMNLGKYAVHAGFYMPILTSELGKMIKKRDLFDREQCMSVFVDVIRSLYQQYGPSLYVENNVISTQNFEQYGENPLMLTCAREYFELKEAIPELQLLLDLAHLKVSCRTLGLTFEEEVSLLIDETDYLHLSGNDGLTDSNMGIEKASDIYNVLADADLTGRTITLEVYSGTEDLERSYALINELI